MYELKQAKIFAMREADTMLKDKLSQCKNTYNSEFEIICKQFEEMQNEVSMLKNDKLKLQTHLSFMERIISQQSNLIETSGVYMLQNDSAFKVKDKQTRQDITELDQLEENDEISEKVKKLFKE